jgi:UDP-N-acetylmuramoyl-tripeptide--D-alanyl-D-alanine ligase
VKKLSFSRIITVGENFEKIKIALSNIEKFSSTKKLLDYLKINPLKDKYVFIKGSRSMQLEKILTVL